jgi:GT2 family glycosyltransferase
MLNPLVSIVIPTHNRREMVKKLIKSIFSSTYKNLEIIVVDDASSDETSEFIKKSFPKSKNLIIIKNKNNLFTAASRNVGLKKSTGELIFFIDDDNILDKRAIEELVKIFNNNNLVGEAGPVNYSPNNENTILFLASYRNMWTTKTYQPRDIRTFKGKKLWETNDIPNAFMVRADIVKKNQIFFRENFGIMYEESDIAYRIRNLGFKIVVVENAKIYHDIEVSEKGEIKKDYMYHFMEDKRRPYVFARNRVIFHSMYSTRIQLIGILFFWVWFFALYYGYKILFYKGIGKFGFHERMILIFCYIKGCFEGVGKIGSDIK